MRTLVVEGLDFWDVLREIGEWLYACVKLAPRRPSHPSVRPSVESRDGTSSHVTLRRLVTLLILELIIAYYEDQRD